MTETIAVDCCEKVRSNSANRLQFAKENLGDNSTLDKSVESSPINAMLSQRQYPTIHTLSVNAWNYDRNKRPMSKAPKAGKNSESKTPENSKRVSGKLVSAPPPIGYKQATTPADKRQVGLRVSCCVAIKCACIHEVSAPVHIPLRYHLVLLSSSCKNINIFLFSSRPLQNRSRYKT